MPSTDPADPSTQKTGKGMLIICWLLILGMLTWFFGNWEDKQYNPNSQVGGSVEGGIRTILLSQNRAGHYIADGSINNSRVTFLLDTGATWVAIPEKLAQQLNLKRLHPVQVSTANGMTQAWITRIDSLKLGTIEFHNLKAAITPGMNHDDTVLLGMNALRGVEMIQQNGQLTIRQYQ